MEISMAQDINDIINMSRFYAGGTTDLKQYVKEATRTESEMDIVVTDQEYFQQALHMFIEAARRLDIVKKNAFYGKPYPNEDNFVPVDKLHGAPPRVFHSLIGILTEAGELAELLEKVSLTDEVVPAEKFADEFGDLNWYQAVGIDALRLSFANILRANIAKLKARYPEKFTSENAINRDLENEENVVRKNALTNDQTPS